MDATKAHSYLARSIALVLVSFLTAGAFYYFDIQANERLDTMPAEAIVAYERHVHSHAYPFHFVTVLVAGGFYLGLVEAVANLVGLTLGRFKR